ncbi:hypothetical protein [Shinella sp. JR1-6]|uniref:hypothetical protein n=1 Tax=Shinella sp. JR1-6 TaxID=2527671 RepID=UPI00102D598C|nr:hypothetical protein [Shinella sp. JR1-6]TAA53905.1 hypothetical protein EXZ48_28045 [Shinella sp. JR1-6]
MLEKDGLLNDLLSGQTIRGISCRTGSAEFQCDDGRSLTLYALPDVYFQPDDVSERLADAPLPQKLRALIGQRIMSVRADGMGDYCMRLGDFAGLRFGKGRSFTGETGAVTNEGQSVLRF